MLSITCLMYGKTLKGKAYEKKLERADELYKGGSFANALPLYLELFEADSANMNVSYKIGSIYLNKGDHKKALPFLTKAASAASATYKDDRKERKAPLSSLRLLADAYHLNYEFDLALGTYEKYKRALESARVHNVETFRELKRKIQICLNAKELVAHPADVKITNMEKNINSPYPDYAPRLSADQCTMIFTSRRPENVGGKTYDEGQYFEDIYIATRKDKYSEWSPARNIGPPINTVGNEAAIGISADGQEILIYKDDMGDGNIYSSKLEGDKWTVPQKLNSNINSKFWEPAAFLSADGKTLYFVSDRPGGYGGTDIYKSKKTPSGDWGRAENLGPTINTPFDEYTPFLHPDGVTLFFSSKGHNTMGGYDVFFSRTLLSDNKIWLEPTNVGYPINTTADDAFYQVSPDKQWAYYSSSREEGLGEKDNYTITFAEVKDEPLALVKGEMLDTNAQALQNMVITVIDNQTGEVVGVYHPNSKTGKYSFILTPGRSHNISYEAEGRLFYSENRYVSETTTFNETFNPVNLPEIKPGAKMTLNNLFFDFDKSELNPASVTELNRIHNFLVKNPGVKIEISGFADSKGSDEYNLRLSQARAQSVVNYLAGKGISKARMKAIGYGEIKSSTATTSQKTKDKTDGRASERRVELKVLEIASN